MGQFTETLTILIEGDSSELRRELDDAARLVDGFQSRLSQVNGAIQQFGTLMERMSGVRSLAVLSNSLEGILQRMQRINNTPLAINVSPALASLTLLSTALDLIQAKLLAVAAASMISGAGGMISAAQPARRFATGGPVTGTPGIDRVPAWLSAGDFVLSRQTVEELGQGWVSALNDHPWGFQGGPKIETQVGNGGGSVNWPGLSSSERGDRGRATGAPGEQVVRVMNVGGMAIHVHQSMDPEGVLRSLRLDGMALRNRRG